MPAPPLFSLIVPTRRRLDKLRRFLTSLAATAADLGRIEAVLVIDMDDAGSRSLDFPGLRLRRVVVQPGLAMGALNQAGYQASTGAYIMLLNDDVIVRTRKWDRKIAACLKRYGDGIVLIHVNDTLFREGMCTFPLVSRTYCELAGGICPVDYLRYRIDDHIEQVFNLLGVLGESRIVYLPDVVFEHEKYVEPAPGRREYYLDHDVEALDAPRFDAYFGARKELAVKLKRQIAPADTEAQWLDQLERVENTPQLRAVGRIHHESRTRRLLRSAKARLPRLISKAHDLVTNARR